MALIQDCGAGPVVTAKDSHSGHDLWTTPLPPDGLNGAQITLVQAAFPTMVHVASQGAQPIDRYYSFDTTGKAQAAIPGTGDFGTLDMNVGARGQQHPVRHIQDTTLVVPTADGDTSASLVAFDLKSGNKLWQTPRRRAVRSRSPAWMRTRSRCSTAVRRARPHGCWRSRRRTALPWRRVSAGALSAWTGGGRGCGLCRRGQADRAAGGAGEGCGRVGVRAALEVGCGRRRRRRHDEGSQNLAS